MGRHPSLTCMLEREDEGWGFPTPRLSPPLDDSRYQRELVPEGVRGPGLAGMVTLVQYLISTNLFSICEMGTKVTNLKETQCGPKGIRHWNYQIITVIFFSPP